jgi:HK97 family phage portal protein
MRLPVILSWLFGRTRASMGGDPGVLSSTNPIGAFRWNGHTGDPWGTLDPGWSAISPAAAEAVAAVGCAVSVIATTLATLPCAVVRADEQRDEVPTHDLMRLIRNGAANENETWCEFLESLVSSCLLRGNATAEISTDQRGRLAALRTLPWPNMVVRITDTGQLLFDFTPSTPPNAGKRRTYAREDLLWLKDRSDDGLVGVSRLQRAGAAMGYAISIQSSAQAFSGNIARPGGVLSVPGNISDDLTTRMKQDWEAAYGPKAERGKVAILKGGTTWTPMSPMTAEDAQLIEARQWSVSDVARIMGVPPWLLGASDRTSTFASAREAMRSFAMLTLQPWANRVQSAFQASVLGPEYRLLFDIGSLTKADTESYSAALLRGRQGGWLSPNDCREEMGWPRVDGGDDISPPNTSAAAVATGDPASADGAGKIVDLHEHRHGAH